MAVEIERKFLVDGDFKATATGVTVIRQGYICVQTGKTVRVRLRGDEAFLTIKGPSDARGLTREEFEWAIPVADAERLFALCEPGMIDKERYLVLGRSTFSMARTRAWSWPRLSCRARQPLSSGPYGWGRR